MTDKQRLFGVVAVSTNLLLLSSGPVAAQGVGAEVRVLEEIVVTARRREENLQDLPLSVAVMTAEEMQTQGVYYANDIAEFIPNVTLNETQRAQTFVVIRGIGGGHPDAAFAWGSGIYVDGHYIPYGRTGYTSTMDIDRIEVLRGPQGTLFGRNTVGGAVNIISTKPQPEFESELTARVGKFGQQDLRAMVNFPISDNVFARLSAASEQSDGYYYNRTLGRDQGARERTEVRAALRFTPGNWTIDTVLASSRQRDEDLGGQCAPGIRGVPWDGRAGVFPAAFAYGEPSGGFSFGPPFFGFSPSTEQPLADADCSAAVAQGEFVTTNELDTFANVDVDSAFLTAAWNSDGPLGGLAGATVTTSLSYRDMVNRNLLDLDYSSLPIFYNASPVSGQTSETTSLEVLFEGVVNERLDFLVGANFFDNNTDNAVGPDCYDVWRAEYDPLTDETVVCPYTNGGTVGLFPLNTLPVGPRPVFTQGARFEKARAVFGHMTYALNDTWDLELGIRYTQDDQHSVHFEAQASNLTTPDPTGCCVYDRLLNAATVIDGGFVHDIRDSFSGTTPRISLTRSLDGVGRLDSGMVYFLISEGYLTGGFNTEVPQGDPLLLPLKTYGPEEVTNYEVGFKGTFASGRLRLNSAVFYMDYTDKQENIVVNPGLDEFGAPIRRLAVRTNAASAAISGIEVELAAAPWDGGVLSVNLGYLHSEYDDFSSINNDGTLIDLTSTEIPNQSPEWTLNASLQHTFTLANGARLTPLLGVYYQSEYNWTSLQFNANSPTGLTPFFGDVPGNLCFDDGYTKLRARLTYDSPTRDYSVSLFGRNITDESILDGCSMRFGQFLSRLEQPASWGVEFTARWGNN